MLTANISTPRNTFLILSIVLILFGLPFLTFKTEANEQNPNNKWYQIEYIIFEHLQTDDHILRFEDTPYPIKKDKSYTIISKNPNPLSTFEYTQLNENEMDLADALKKLKWSKAVGVLDAKAWQQPLVEEKTAYPVKIDKELSKGRTLFGEIQLRKSRYTHAEVELYLAEKVKYPFEDLKTWLLTQHSTWSVFDIVSPVTKPNAILTEIGTSDLYKNIRYVKESRRIKDGEIHYIDHPTIGIIISIKEVSHPNSSSDF